MKTAINVPFAGGSQRVAGTVRGRGKEQQRLRKLRRGGARLRRGDWAARSRIARPVSTGMKMKRVESESVEVEVSGSRLKFIVHLKTFTARE